MKNKAILKAIDSQFIQVYRGGDREKYDSIIIIIILISNIMF